jgi:hypothetical protein
MNSFVVAVFGWLRAFADGVVYAGTDIGFQVIGGLLTRMPMLTTVAGISQGGQPCVARVRARAGVEAASARSRAEPSARCWRRTHIA